MRPLHDANTRLLFSISILLTCIIGLRGNLLADPVQESLKDSPWYEEQTDRYHKYSPDEIRAPNRKKEEEINRVEKGEQLERPEKEKIIIDNSPAISGTFLQIIFFILIGLLAAGVIYFIYKVIKERRGLSQDLMHQEMQISHSDLPEVLIEKTGATGPLTSDTLVDSIEDALRRKDYRMAAIFIYLYSLLRLQSHGLIKIHRNYTAREYMRLLKQREGMVQAQELQPLFQQVVRVFEFALYRGKLPTNHNIPTIWQDLQHRFAT